MHQDFDPRDLEPVVTSEQSAGLRRWLPLAVAFAAVSGFAGIVWYAYGRSGPQTVDNPALAPLVQADSREYKRKPDSPGGIDVPNQDKLLLNKGAVTTDPQVERILPPPETPLPKPLPAPNVAGMAPPPASAPRIAVQSQPVPSGQQTASMRQAQTVSAPMPLAPVPSQSVPSQSVPPQPVAAPPPPQVAPQVAVASPPKLSAGGHYRIQLASVRTAEQAEKEWQRIKASSPEMTHLTMTPAKVDLGAKGVFYRVQAGPVADAATAERLCTGLKSKGQGCIIVRP